MRRFARRQPGRQGRGDGPLQAHLRGRRRYQAEEYQIDTLSRAFAGNEIDRGQVYAFAMHMQALAKVAAGSVTVLSHPSLAGISFGLWYVGLDRLARRISIPAIPAGHQARRGEQPDTDLRQLEFKKNQYGPIGENIALRYQRGLFLPEGGISGLDAIARAAKGRGDVSGPDRRYDREGRNVSDKPTSPTYAPALFCREEGRQGAPQRGHGLSHAPTIPAREDTHRELRETVAPCFEN